MATLAVYDIEIKGKRFGTDDRVFDAKINASLLHDRWKSLSSRRRAPRNQEQTSSAAVSEALEAKRNGPGAGRVPAFSPVARGWDDLWTYAKGLYLFAS
jgi:hypothetical protein